MMHRSIPSFLSALALLALVAVHGGCASSTGSPASADAQPFAALQKGMSADEVRALLGAPESVVPGTHRSVASETWSYSRPIRTTTTQAATSIREVDSVDPITGREFKMKEPVYQTVVVRVIENARLLFIERKLVEWNTTREATRNF